VADAQPAITVEKPPITVELIWAADLRFGATSGNNALILDSEGVEGPNPVQLLLIGLAGCMSMDVVDIIRKGRHQMSGFRSHLTGERMPEAPRYVRRVTLEFHLRGDIPPAAVERAIMLSREKYCSVWHSLRTDIEMTTSFTISP
jgi:putative redox protein